MPDGRDRRTPKAENVWPFVLVGAFAIPGLGHQVSTHWIGDEERLRWTVQRVDRITDRWPQIPTEQVVNRICMRAGLEGPMARTQVLTALQSIKEKKNSPLWAPWDIVFQPGIQILIIAVGLLGLFLLASSL
jgi:hypothetical protein